MAKCQRSLNEKSEKEIEDYSPSLAQNDNSIFSTTRCWTSPYEIPSPTMSLVETAIQSNLKQILETIQLVARECGRLKLPRLVAVSKRKSANLIQECYQAGQRHFGENYVQELEEKGTELSSLQDIKWHFIGQIQSNKIPKICSVPNLYCIETLDNQKHALLLEKELHKRALKIKVFIQVNTSGEEQKGGMTPEEAKEFGQFIIESCQYIELSGFMTIGSVAGSSMVPNLDFERLRQLRNDFAKEAGQDPEYFELSMGMSDDYETAIRQGSTNIRVGSKIFGPRLM